jgi:hypothetical protein
MYIEQSFRDSQAGELLKAKVKLHLLSSWFKEMRDDESLGSIEERYKAMATETSRMWALKGHQLGSGKGEKAARRAVKALDAVLDGLAPTPEAKLAIMKEWIDKHSADADLILSDKVINCFIFVFTGVFVIIIIGFDSV